MQFRFIDEENERIGLCKVDQPHALRARIFPVESADHYAVGAVHAVFIDHAREFYRSVKGRAPHRDGVGISVGAEILPPPDGVVLRFALPVHTARFSADGHLFVIAVCLAVEGVPVVFALFLGLGVGHAAIPVVMRGIFLGERSFVYAFIEQERIGIGYRLARFDMNFTGSLARIALNFSRFGRLRHDEIKSVAL